jgi:uncharacterized protein YjlB
MFGRMKMSSAKNTVVGEAEVRACVLKDDGTIPNNRMPLLLYVGALSLPERNGANLIEELLEENGWGGSWRNGIYSYQHFHSTAHEVLLVYSGSARVQLGGEHGIIETIRKGDVIVIPAGVGHKNLGSDPDFAIVGAYPDGQEADLCTGKPGERTRVIENVVRVGLPQKDPVYGEHGPMVERWKDRNHK